MITPFPGMCIHVSSERRRVRKHGIASLVVAMVRFFPVMCPLVYYKMFFTCTLIVTPVMKALIRFFPGMRPHMLRQISFACTLVTASLVRAKIGSFPGMCYHVSCKVALLCTLVIATFVRTMERFFSGMCPRVFCKISFPHTLVIASVVGTHVLFDSISFQDACALQHNFPLFKNFYFFWAVADELYFLLYFVKDFFFKELEEVNGVQNIIHSPVCP